MQLFEAVSLKPYNSFGIAVTARYFASFDTVEGLQELLYANKLPVQQRLVLGGGSNVLFTADYNGLVLLNKISGITLVHEDADAYYVRVGAGENWHAFVMDCVRNNRAGVENLSLIPGSVGASPIQNIGAYGVEVKDAVHTVEAWHINDKKLVTFQNHECQFGYRDSIFKRQYRNQLVITHVTFRLLKRPVFHTAYGAIRQELERMGVQALSIGAIAQAVMNIRSSKLPNPQQLGNAGSFFKNPIVPARHCADLMKKYPQLPAYPNADGSCKLAAGWLIEQCGWKGYRKGDAGCYEKQALVLVNYGNATGTEIWQLSQQIAASVAERFGVHLEPEVNLIQ